MSPRRPIGRAGQMLVSALDPLVTSGAMFLVQGVVLLSSDKTEFATYSLAYSYVVMGQAVLSALFGSPLITLLAGIDDECLRAQTGEAALRFQLSIAVVLGLTGLTLAMAIGLPVLIACLVILGILGLSFRDALRSVLAAQMRLAQTVAIALWFAGATAVALGAIFLVNKEVTATLGLAALAIGAFVTLTKPIAAVVASKAPLPRTALHKLIGMAVWSLPGAVVIWLQNSFYLTLVALNLSMNAVGEVSAARMVAMPILITASGFLRLAQVQASRHLATGGLPRAIANAQWLAIFSLGAGAMMVTMCWIADRAIDTRWLPNAYPHLLILAAAWLAFAAATTARGFYSSLFQAMGRYREIFVLNLVVLPFVLTGIAAGPLAFGLIGAVFPMALGEIALLGLLAWRSRYHALATTRMPVNAE